MRDVIEDGLVIRDGITVGVCVSADLMSDWLPQNEDKMVLEAALQVMSKALNDLVSACMDGDKTKAPDKKALMKARSMLPPYCDKSLK